MFHAPLVGKYIFLKSTESTLVFKKVGKQGETYFIFNMQEKPMNDLPQEMQHTRFLNLMSREVVDVTDKIMLNKYGYLILKKESR